MFIHFVVDLMVDTSLMHVGSSKTIAGHGQRRRRSESGGNTFDKEGQINLLSPNSALNRGEGSTKTTTR